MFGVMEKGQNRRKNSVGKMATPVRSQLMFLPQWALVDADALRPVFAGEDA
jgi:hypothetical protein